MAHSSLISTIAAKKKVVLKSREICQQLRPWKEYSLVMQNQFN